MMTHRALLAEYTSTLIARDIRAEDRSLAALPALPLCADACFLMPQPLIGATTLLHAKPAARAVLRAHRARAA